MSDLLTYEAEAWRRVLDDTGASIAGPVIVRGPAAEQVADALRRLGANGSLTADPARVSAEAPVEGRADLVVLTHAWEARRELDDVARCGAEALTPGGTLLLAELDVDRLLSSAPSRFPSVLLYRSHPELAEALAAASPPVVELVMAAVRAGLAEKIVTEVDRPVGVFAEPGEYRSALEFGVWRGMETLTRGDYEMVVEAAVRIPRAEWPVVDMEPWLVVAGRARD